MLSKRKKIWRYGEFAGKDDAARRQRFQGGEQPGVPIPPWHSPTDPTLGSTALKRGRGGPRRLRPPEAKRKKRLEGSHVSPRSRILEDLRRRAGTRAKLFCNDCDFKEGKCQKCKKCLAASSSDPNSQTGDSSDKNPPVTCEACGESPLVQFLTKQGLEAFAPALETGAGLDLDLLLDASKEEIFEVLRGVGLKAHECLKLRKHIQEHPRWKGANDRTATLFALKQAKDSLRNLRRENGTLLQQLSELRKKHQESMKKQEFQTAPRKNVISEIRKDFKFLASLKRKRNRLVKKATRS